MPKLIHKDDEGKEVEVEIEYTPDQIEELKKKAEEADVKMAEFTKSIEEKETELAKLRDKDMNFSKFRERTEEEKKKWEESLKGDVKEVYEQLNELKTERETEKTKRWDSAKKAILTNLAGDDEDLKKSIEAKATDFVGEAVTEEELEKRYRQSFTLIKEERPKPVPLYEVNPSGSFVDPSDKPADYVKTQHGKETYTTLFGREPLTPDQIKELGE